jgi:Flp pilus assembly protein TadG
MKFTHFRNNLRSRSGQSLVETALMLPMLLTLVFNAMNFGYFFLISVNLAAAPRTATEYSVQGPDTPIAQAFAPAGPVSGTGSAISVSFLLFEDMRGAMSADTTNSSVQVCTQANGVTNGGTSTATATCTTYGASIPAGFSFPTPNSDPELQGGPTSAVAFILNRVDVFYKFKPLIPGGLFNLVLMGTSGTVCSSASGTCVFHRQASMRAM